MSSKPETCPLCKENSTPAFKPFCSKGCKDRDLLNWLGDGYALPVRQHEESDDSGLDSTPKPSL